MFVFLAINKMNEEAKRKKKKITVLPFSSY